MRCRFTWLEIVLVPHRRQTKKGFKTKFKPGKAQLQCRTTTRVKTQCWRRFQLCGFHAAMLYPNLYPKSTGAKTGGRHGLSKNSDRYLAMILLKEERRALELSNSVS